ncbi:MAG: hypothetical protein RJA52_1145 [Bacteroidota bacterium]|jgi:hypothetical protein
MSPIYLNKKIFKHKIIVYPKQQVNAVFVHIPKTAGTSIKVFCGQNNIKILGHGIYEESFKYLKDLQCQFHDTFLFTVCRHPLTRAISAFYYLSTGGQTEQDKKDAEKYILPYSGNFTEFVLNEFPKGEILEQIHFIPQYKWVCDDKEELLVDFVCKYENLENDFRKIATIFGNRFFELPKLNRTTKFSNSVDINQVEKHIKEAYGKDYALFNYEGYNYDFL